MAAQGPNPEINRPRPGSRRAGGERLDSWKEIAAYFQRDIRTVQRWERTEGLPVHRHAHPKGGSVYAFTAELETWWHGRSRQLAPEAPSPSRRRHWAWISAAALAICAAAGWAFLSLTSRARALRPARPGIPGRLFANASREGASIRWIPVGSHPWAAAISPDGSRVYVANQYSGSISVISAAQNAATGVIYVGGEPSELAIAGDGRRLYAANRSGYVSEIDLATGAVRSIPVGAPVNDLALTPDGRHLYAATGFHGLQEITLPDRKVRQVPAQAAPMYLAAAPDGARVYVNYQAGGPKGRPGHDGIDFVDVLSGQMMGAISGPPNVGGPLAASPDGSQVWAAGEDACANPGYDHAGCPVVPGGIINIIRVSDNEVVRTLGLADTGTNEISFFPDGTRAVLSGATAPIRVIDTTRLTTVEKLDLGEGRRVVFTNDGRRAYCPAPSRDAVAVFDLADKSCAAAPPGLLDWWPGDGSPGDLRASGNSENGNQTAYAPGLVGQAFRLIPGRTPLDLSPSYGSSHDQMTVVAWVKPLSAEAGRETGLLDFRGSNGWGWQVTRTSAGQLRLCAFESAAQNRRAERQSAETSVAVPLGVWTQIAVSRDAREISARVDGAAAARVSASGMPGPDNVRLTIGLGSASVAALDGLVDEVQWFRRALAPRELQSIGKARSAGVCYGEPSAQP